MRGGTGTPPRARGRAQSDSASARLLRKSSPRRSGSMLASARESAFRSHPHTAKAVIPIRMRTSDRAMSSMGQERRGLRWVVGWSIGMTVTKASSNLHQQGGRDTVLEVAKVGRESGDVRARRPGVPARRGDASRPREVVHVRAPVNVLDPEGDELHRHPVEGEGGIPGLEIGPRRLGEVGRPRRGRGAVDRREEHQVPTGVQRCAPLPNVSANRLSVRTRGGCRPWCRGSTAPVRSTSRQRDSRRPPHSQPASIVSVNAAMLRNEP